VEPHGDALLEGGEHPIGADSCRCYLAGAVNLSPLAIVFLPPAVGAGYYFGGPVIGSVWVGVILLTCLALSLQCCFASNKSKRDTKS
jgi:hypothetical protein